MRHRLLTHQPKFNRPATTLIPVSKRTNGSEVLRPNGRQNGKPGTKGTEFLIREVLRKHATPLMLIERETLARQYQRFQRALPNVKPYYAIKANPHPDIVKYFIKLGAGFDVASGNEMAQVLRLGAKPDQIIFANTIKSIADIQLAYRSRVRFMTFDNEPELYKIAKFAPRSRVLVRIKVINMGSQVELSLKFGADPDQAVFLLEKAKALGLKPEGISFHAGSQCRFADSYIDALRVTSNLFKEGERSGLHLHMLDIGGGFPIKHFDREDGPTFEDIARKIRKALRKLFDLKKVQIMAEPGRFLVGPAGTLITQVVGRTFRNNRNYYYLNDGVYGDFSGIVFDNCKYELKTLRRGQKFLSTVAGPTCDSFDVVSPSEELPELDVGNVVYVKNIGAYSSASAVPCFNGFFPARTILV
ncbi:MAG: type III PLP-dependent enzyme [Candidatus Omnitrophica bacterium]|nr:type III PLP-dependent enzyme [Candidatus Omnitrophota bacterium]